MASVIKEVDLYVTDFSTEAGDGMVEITARSRTGSIELKFLTLPGHDIAQDQIFGGKRFRLTLEDLK